MFLTTDTNGTRLRDNNKNNNQSLWRQWNATKSAIIKCDNLVVKKAINRIPGKALPYGTDFNTIFQYLRYELYLVRSSNAQKLVVGTADKETGTQSQTLYPPTKYEQVVKQESEEHKSQQESIDQEARDNQHDNSEDNNEEVGKTAPKDFYPPRILAIMVIGVLSNEMDPVLGYTEDNISGENVSAVPSREQLHNDAALEISISPLTSLASRTTDQGVISRVSNRANYTAELFQPQMGQFT